MAWAHQTGAWYGGVGVYSQNSLNKIAEKETGETGLLGANSYPLLIKHVMMLGSWKWVPAFHYTVLPRTGKDDIKSTIMIFGLPFGGEFNSTVDWTLGPAISRFTVQGPGGTVNLNNGTGTAQFARPSKSVTSTIIAIQAGVGFELGTVHLDVGTFLNGFLASGEILKSKRTFDFYTFLTIPFGGGGH